MTLGGPNIYPGVGTWLGVARVLYEHCYCGDPAFHIVLMGCEAMCITESWVCGYHLSLYRNPEREDRYFHCISCGGRVLEFEFAIDVNKSIE